MTRAAAAGPAVVAGARVAAVAVLAAVAGLLTWALLPLALGWTPHVVLTGSMVPRVRPGDVVVTAPSTSDRVLVGQVVVVPDPDGSGRRLAHRVVARDPDGSLRTRGDANAADDPAPVRPGTALGIARLRVPAVGLPDVWLAQGATGRAALLALVLLACGGLAVTGRPGSAA